MRAPISESATTGTNTAAMAAGDLEIVNYALTLEYIEADFYAKVIESGLFSGASLEMIKVIGDHEQQHVDALLGTAKKLGEPAAKPETTFPLDSADSVLELAATVENLGAAAYLGQAGAIKNKEILAAAIAIHSVEARHAAALNILTGNPRPPTAPSPHRFPWNRCYRRSSRSSSANRLRTKVEHHMHSKLIVPAVQEGAGLEAVEIHGMNRGSFLLKSTLAVGAVYGAAAVGPFVQRAMAQDAMGDIDILNFALTLEFLEADLVSPPTSAPRRRNWRSCSASTSPRTSRRSPRRSRISAARPSQNRRSSSHSPTRRASSSSLRRSKIPASAPTTAPPR